MIGKESFRRKGFGREALLAAESLAKHKLHMRTAVAKVATDNEASKKFFAKRGYADCGTLNGEVVFKKQL